MIWRLTDSSGTHWTEQSARRFVDWPFYSCELLSIDSVRYIIITLVSFDVAFLGLKIRVAIRVAMTLVPSRPRSFLLVLDIEQIIDCLYGC